MIDALVLARDKSHQGGVVSFVELLVENFSNNVRATRFVIGRSPEKRSYSTGVIAAIRDAIRLARVLRKKRYDIIHINPSLTFSAMARDGLFMTVLLVSGARHIVVFVHGWHEPFFQQIKKHWLTRFILRNLLQRAASILVLATQFKWALCAIGLDERRIFVLTTMFDRKMFEGIQRQRRGSKFRLLFLSRLIREKGVHELLSAFLLLVERVPALELVIAGDGPEYSPIRQRILQHNISDKVTLTGYLRGQDKAKALLDADLFVLPTSYGEGCPVSLLEAMAAGLAIITTPVGGILDFFVDGENGIVISSVSASDIACAVEELVTDKARMARIRARNKQQAWERFEAATVTLKVEKIYEWILAEK
ncbi:MAG: glycosyltransferase family 4 protein [Pseudomonadota bacterium]|nr:glycosyltransferase family 4 protein [Pseudomonadota bacterium]